MDLLAQLLDAPVQPGALLGGRYRVERVLGTGGMGTVVRAHHLVLEQPVALKFLRPVVASSAEVRARFLREARAAARLQSEHVCRVLDAGELDGGLLYIAMEYLEGDDLHAVLERRGPLGVGEAACYLVQACAGLAEAHAAGIVHRDLKPSNLFLTRRPDGVARVKVLDFGIAKLTEPERGAELVTTRTSAIMGSPLYMAPEQVSSARDVDRRADVWALGAVLYQLVTGKTPFVAESIPELWVKVLQEAPRPITAHGVDLPAGFAEIVMRCLASDLAERFAGVEELALALRPFADAQVIAPLPLALDATALPQGQVDPRLLSPRPGGVADVVPPPRTAIGSALVHPASVDKPIATATDRLTQRSGRPYLKWIAGAALITIGALANLVIARLVGRETPATPPATSAAAVGPANPGPQPPVATTGVGPPAPAPSAAPSPAEKPPSLDAGPPPGKGAETPLSRTDDARTAEPTGPTAPRPKKVRRTQPKPATVPPPPPPPPPPDDEAYEQRK